MTFKIVSLSITYTTKWHYPQKKNVATSISTPLLKQNIKYTATILYFSN